MKKERFSEGVHNVLDQALAENGEAKLRFEAMTAEERQKFRQRAQSARTLREAKKLTDDLVGWQEGHPPYQL